MCCVLHYFALHATHDHRHCGRLRSWAVYDCAMVAAEDRTSWRSGHVLLLHAVLIGCGVVVVAACCAETLCIVSGMDLLWQLLIFLVPEQFIYNIWAVAASRRPRDRQYNDKKQCGSTKNVRARWSRERAEKSDQVFYF